MKNKSIVILSLSLILTASAQAQQSLDAMVDREIGSLVSTYKMLHAAPELSHYEIKTSDRKSTRLNSSHVRISYAVFRLKKKNTKAIRDATAAPRIWLDLLSAAARMLSTSTGETIRAYFFFNLRSPPSPPTATGPFPHA